jgi:hypothetical protein
MWHELRPLIFVTSLLIALACTCVLAKLPEHVGNWLASLGAIP